MTVIKLLLVSANRLTNPYPVYPLGLAYLDRSSPRTCSILKNYESP